MLCWCRANARLCQNHHKVGVPTLVLAGDDDAISTITEMKAMIGSMDPDLVTFERVPEGRHFLYIDEQQIYFNAIKKFIEN